MKYVWNPKFSYTAKFTATAKLSGRTAKVSGNVRYTPSTFEPDPLADELRAAFSGRGSPKKANDPKKP